MNFLAPALVASALFLAIPASAGPAEDIHAAYHRGDFATALRLARPLADQGNPHAQFYLGVMYAHGHGVPQDYLLAIAWYRDAARQGLPSAQYNLGLMYEEGEGVARDLVQAYKWYDLAAARLAPAETEKRGEAIKSRDDVAARMTPVEIAAARKLVLDWERGAR